MESVQHSSPKTAIFRPWENHQKCLIEPGTSCSTIHREAFSFPDNHPEATLLESNILLPRIEMHEDDGLTIRLPFRFGLVQYETEHFNNFPWAEWESIQSDVYFRVLSKSASVPTTFHQNTEQRLKTFEQQQSFTCSTLFGGHLSKHQKTRRRIRDEKKRFHCSVCHSVFSNKGQLKGHLRIHTGERPFVCPQCLKTFTRNEELTRHKRIHSGIRPFACDKCGKSFGRKDHLKKHSRIHNRIQTVLNETNPDSTVYLQRPRLSHLFTPIVS